MRDVQRGTHTVRVVRDGYIGEERRVSITALRPSQSLTFELTRARPAATAPAASAALEGEKVPLTVESRPAGASVFVDGTLIGKTPLTLGEVAAGDHAVSLDLDGYRRWSSSVRIIAGERNRVTASLELP
jgi:predicted acylesterase/phospholipase RssA